MARSTFPDAIQMRHLKFGRDVPVADKDRLAAALRAAGRRAEAVLLYEGRPDAADLEADLGWAVAEGASFYPLMLRRMGLAVPDDRVRACAEAAERKGRWNDAKRCYTALADAAGLERVAPHLPGYVPPPLPVLPIAPPEGPGAEPAPPPA